MIPILDYMIRAALISFFPLLIADCIVLDRLVRLEYSNWKKEWDKDGRPHGYFWVPPESKIFGGLLVSVRSSRALRNITLEWFFQTPGWMARQETARRLLWLHRLLVVALWLPIISLFWLALRQ